MAALGLLRRDSVAGLGDSVAPLFARTNRRYPAGTHCDTATTHRMAEQELQYDQAPNESRPQDKNPTVSRHTEADRLIPGCAGSSCPPAACGNAHGHDRSPYFGYLGAGRVARRVAYHSNACRIGNDCCALP